MKISMNPVSQLRSFITYFGMFLIGCTLLIANFLQILSLIFWPFSKTLFRKINLLIAGHWWSSFVEFGLRWGQIRVTITGDSVPFKENAIVIANHQCMADILLILVLAKDKKRIQDLKFFAKKVIKYVPGVGWGMQFLDCVFLDRDWSKDHKHIQKTFQKFNQWPIDFWLTSFPEGTRLTPQKLQKSQTLQKKRKQPITHHVLAPRIKGFTSTIHGIRNKTAAVYDLTLIYKKGPPPLSQLLSLKGTEARIHVKRYPIHELPHSEHELAQWLSQRFFDKEALLKH